MAPQHLFCFGLGYSAKFLAKRLVAADWQVSGTCRSQAKATGLREAGITVYTFGDGKPLTDIQQALGSVTHVLSSVPPSANNDPVLDAHQAELSAVCSELQWIGYLSTIGVYGDQQGRWIDESCPPAPISMGSRQRVEAEQQWLAFGRENHVPVQIFRLPGIYGPDGRSQIDALKAGRAYRIVKPGQVFNRIHVDDLVTVLMASMAAPNGSAVYNVADDEPAPANDIVTYAAKLLGVEPPPEVAFDEAEMSPMAAHFFAECKRVRNDRIKQELGVTLRYPTYREGLAAIFSRLS